MAVVRPESELVQIPLHVLLRDVNVRRVDGALERAPERLHAVDVVVDPGGRIDRPFTTGGATPERNFTGTSNKKKPRRVMAAGRLLRAVEAARFAV